MTIAPIVTEEASSAQHIYTNAHGQLESSSSVRTNNLAQICYMRSSSGEQSESEGSDEVEAGNPTIVILPPKSCLACRLWDRASKTGTLAVGDRE